MWVKRCESEYPPQDDADAVDVIVIIHKGKRLLHFLSDLNLEYL